jgi:hypothetical protein
MVVVATYSRLLQSLSQREGLLLEEALLDASAIETRGQISNLKFLEAQCPMLQYIRVTR